MSESLLGTIDVARMLGVTSCRVYQLEKEGKLRASRTLSGRRIFQFEDVEELRLKREQLRAAR